MTHHTNSQTEIKDLAVIGDRRTCSLISKEGNIVWYCPGRFDKEAFASSLIDPEKGGYWSFDYKGKSFRKRSYLENSGILVTEFEGLRLTEFMPTGCDRSGIIRMFSEAEEAVEQDIYLKPCYGLGLPEYDHNEKENIISISRKLCLTASHQLEIKDGHIHCTFPKGEKGWAFLSDQPLQKSLYEEEIIGLKQETTDSWKEISSRVEYSGPYEKQVRDSLRAIQLLTYEENGGVIAAATTSLPEVVGGERNYDYRYVWLRDSAMITSALIRASEKGQEGKKFLSFLCDAKYRNSQKILLPFYSLDKLVASPEESLPLDGYKNSRPVRTGNDAMDQLQLDANANVLLAAKLVYSRSDDKHHWDTVSAIADRLVERWKEKDHGIWEEQVQEHFTSSKVVVAKSLEFLSEFAESEEQKARWTGAAKDIRSFIKKNCLTKEGAYATYAGSDRVDVTAALFPVWLFTEPDSPEMKKTAEMLEKNHREGELYHRTLEAFDAFDEGVFLAGCLWVAQYYIMLEDLDKSGKIIDAALEFSNDLGFFAEEGNVKTGEMLGNFPQTFVHASFIGVIIDLKHKMEELDRNS